MGRAPCCDKANVKKGPWSPEEDAKLKEFIEKYGTGGNWIALPHKAGLKRCGKSCRLRWLNYLRPNIKHGEFSPDEDRIICTLFASIGSRWSVIAAQLPGRTDNDIKNYWNTKLKKKLLATTAPHQRKSQLQQPFTSTPSQVSSYSSSSYFPGPDQHVLSISHMHQPMSSTSISTTDASLLHGRAAYHHSGSDSLLMFGREQSCSSSDGSCSQIRYGKEGEYGSGGGGAQEMTLEGLLFEEINHQKLVSMPPGGGSENVGLFGFDTQLDYGLEEIKQLISSSNGCNSNTDLFLDDSISVGAIRGGSYKSQERAMYYC